MAANPDVIAMMRALVAQPSVSSADPRYDQSNLQVVELLAEWLENLGFAIRMQPLSATKANLIATLGEPREAGGLVLSGHTDTVPCDEQYWSVDPFKLSERDNRYYGLGSADMKSFFALVLEAVKDYRAKDCKQPLILFATADEESTMAGARALVREGIKEGRYAVIGEPTNLQPIRMHKGVLMESIRIHGQAGHSSNPKLGANAIEAMHEIIAALLSWREELQARYRNPAFEVQVPTLNLGSIHGGDNPNRICSKCDIAIDLRLLPGMELEELKQRLRARLQPIFAARPAFRLEVNSLFEGVPSFEVSEQAHIVKTCEAHCGKRSGAVAFGTEAPFLSQLGLETVVMGPGCIDQAHQADEYIAMEQIKPALGLIRHLVERYCIMPDEARARK